MDSFFADIRTLPQPIAAAVLTLLYLLLTVYVCYTVGVGLFDHTVKASRVERIGVSVVLFSFWYIVTTGGSMMLIDFLYPL